MNGYVAFYNGKQKDIYADTLYAAKQEAIKQFNVPKKKESMVSVVLAEKDVDPETGKGTEVVHVSDF